MPTDGDFYTFVEPGWVSVWIGDFRSEDEFDTYLFDEFAGEFGFEIPPQAVREIGVEAEPIEISKLVDGFSRSKTFDLGVIRAAEALGISRASCMLVVYNFAYRSSKRMPPSNRIKFVGSVPFPGFE